MEKHERIRKKQYWAYHGDGSPEREITVRKEFFKKTVINFIN
jgi:hypothetical protein